MYNLRNISRLKLKFIFSLLLGLLFIYLIYIILFIRINNVTLNDQFGLLGLMPNFYIFLLIISAVFCLISFYFKESWWSISFASMFIIYFVLIPYFVEPLHGIDAYYHLSRTLVVLEHGNIPTSTIGDSYFNYPGSTIFGSIFIQITGINNLQFIKIIFPLLQTFLFFFSFFVLIKKIFNNLLPVGPSFLLLCLFGYGGLQFSPFGFAWMIIPLILLTLVSDRRESVICFSLLTFTLVISHPTTSIFLCAVLPFFIFILKLNKKIEVKITMFLLHVLLFIIMTVAWSYFVASSPFDFFVSFVNSIRKTLFENSNIPSLLLQEQFILSNISILRRFFVILGTLLGSFSFIFGLIKIIRKKSINTKTIEWISLSLSFIGVGMLLFIPFLIFYSGFSYTYTFEFGLFGACLIFGSILIPAKRKEFFVFILIVTLLIMPSFTARYPEEFTGLVQEPMTSGMKFTGTYVNLSSSILLSPLETQLQYFLPYDHWTRLEYPVESNILLEQVKGCNYFIYRIDGAYQAAQYSYKPMNETFYMQLVDSMKNNVDFNIIYSNSFYEVFIRTVPLEIIFPNE